MILPITEQQAGLLTSGEKRSALVKDRAGRWKVGREVNPWIGWPVAGGRRVNVPARLYVQKVVFALLLVRDNTCHLYLSSLGWNLPPDEVLRWDSPEMAKLARLEGFESASALVNFYIPGWKVADPDDWQFWEGKIIYW